MQLIIRAWTTPFEMWRRIHANKPATMYIYIYMLCMVRLLTIGIFQIPCFVFSVRFWKWIFGYTKNALDSQGQGMTYWYTVFLYILPEWFIIQYKLYIHPFGSKIKEEKERKIRLYPEPFDDTYDASPPVCEEQSQSPTHIAWYFFI